MVRNDGTVRGSLLQLKSPITSARWFVEPATDSVRDKNVAEFVEKNLFEGLSTSWPMLLNDVLLMANYGHMVLEKVFTQNHPLFPGKTAWQKLAPRHPLDIMEWGYDGNGGPDYIKMYAMGPHGEEPPKIPISKLLIFSIDAEAGDLNGTSVLRSAYKHWYYKENLYKIDAIQKERHGIGIPVIQLPPGFSEADRRAAEDLGRNLRTNDRAHVVLPPNWILEFAKLQGQPVDALKSIDHHDREIRRNILMPDDPKADQQAPFLKATRYLADTVAAIFNSHAIPQLVELNYSRVKPPKLRVRRIGEWDDLRTLTFSLRNLVGSGIIVPDLPLENAMRREFDLPPVDPSTSRVMATPQAPGGAGEPNAQSAPVVPGQGGGPGGPPAPPKPARVGLPRQTPRANVGPPRTNAGSDRSGG
jgi:hypothetical protein